MLFVSNIMTNETHGVFIFFKDKYALFVGADFEKKNCTLFFKVHEILNKIKTHCNFFQSALNSGPDRVYTLFIFLVKVHLWVYINFETVIYKKKKRRKKQADPTKVFPTVRCEISSCRGINQLLKFKPSK